MMSCRRASEKKQEDGKKKVNIIGATKEGKKEYQSVTNMSFYVVVVRCGTFWGIFVLCPVEPIK